MKPKTKDKKQSTRPAEEFTEFDGTRKGKFKRQDRRRKIRGNPRSRDWEEETEN